MKRRFNFKVMRSEAFQKVEMERGMETGDKDQVTEADWEYLCEKLQRKTREEVESELESILAKNPQIIRRK